MPEAHGAEEVVGVVEAHGFAHREGREVDVRLEVHTVFGVRRRLAEVAEVRLEARVVQRLRVVEGQELLFGECVGGEGRNHRSKTAAFARRRHHNLTELSEVDLAVPAVVNLCNQGVDAFVGGLLADLLQHLLELVAIDRARAVRIVEVEESLVGLDVVVGQVEPGRRHHVRVPLGVRSWEALHHRRGVGPHVWHFEETDEMLPEDEADELALLALARGSRNRRGKGVVLLLQQQPGELGHWHLEPHHRHRLSHHLPGDKAL
mmetsp:Transcript_69669/g.157516  ORF Transcript_69669/g.157516 Transcript_69669/m.157516 type:complete len:262 (-) Transcript_69669:2307-3092(-)